MLCPVFQKRHGRLVQMKFVINHRPVTLKLGKRRGSRQRGSVDSVKEECSLFKLRSRHESSGHSCAALPFATFVLSTEQQLRCPETNSVDLALTVEEILILSFDKENW